MTTQIYVSDIIVLIFVVLSAIEAKVNPSPKFDTYKTHPCIRPCVERRPQNCYYDFVLEYYYTLNKACYECPFNHTDCFRPHCIPADGVSRGVLVANRMLPGPAIHVCKGDTVVVNIDNRLTGGEGTSIHWHGVHQRGTPYMDGVAMLTQCPIPAAATFEYRFKADNSGTHYWHAHSGLQRADGLFGPFVVRDTPQNEAHLGLYEDDLPEHTMVVNDWLVEMIGERFAHHHHSDGDNKPMSLLINGKGVLQKFFDNTDNTTTYTPVEIFHVKLGRRYRFRTISNGIMNCPIQISIDNHTLTMIASDGNPFKKIDVHSFNIFAGERFDFVLNASMPVGNYWVRARGLADCSNNQAKQAGFHYKHRMDAYPIHSPTMQYEWATKGVFVSQRFQVAILRYEGAPKRDPKGSTTWENANRPGKRLNPWNRKADVENIAVSQLTTSLTYQKPFKLVPDKKFYLAMDFNKIDNYHFHYVPYYRLVDVDRKHGHLYIPQINHISFKLPASPPLSQLDDIPEDMFCDHDTLPKSVCSKAYCECVYLIKVALNDDVEIVVIDEGVTFDSNHPVHIHGYSFHVVGLDKLNRSTSIEEVKRLDTEGRLHRNLTHAVAKDSVTVPDGGYTILRFHADNPGFWFFHCHIEFHVDIGMAVVIQVGDKEDMPPVPKGFPKCGNWHFDGYQEDEPMNHTETKPDVNSATNVAIPAIAILACILINFM